MQVDRVRGIASAILESTGRYYVGKKLVLKKLLSAALANGHVLFEDYPGLGKTLLAKIFSRITGCAWKRVQFTPDLMPADIIGTRVWRMRESRFVLEKGPIFTNILLADEINRSPPKTQSALLEAMEERQVTIEGETHPLSPPFFVIATQNPIELEGTYPLPEAQMDRFLVKMNMGYVDTLEEESMILKRRINWRRDDPTDMIQSVIDQRTFIQMQNFIENQIYVDEKIIDYISEIVRLTRKHPAVEVGASPRGGLAILKLSRSNAAISGRSFVTPDDVKMFALEALGHRIIMKMEYVLEGDFSIDSVISDVLGEVEVPKDYIGKR
ncbi:MAG: AAA family ATPase [Candidatus Bathyarchaeia archaeon]